MSWTFLKAHAMSWTFLKATYNVLDICKGPDNVLDVFKGPCTVMDVLKLQYNVLDILKGVYNVLDLFKVHLLCVFHTIFHLVTISTRELLLHIKRAPIISITCPMPWSEIMLYGKCTGQKYALVYPTYPSSKYIVPFSMIG